VRRFGSEDASGSVRRGFRQRLRRLRRKAAVAGKRSACRRKGDERDPASHERAAHGVIL